MYRAQEQCSDQHWQAAAEQRLPELDVVVHTTFVANAPLSQVHIQAEEIKRMFRQAYPNVGAITIHTEPPGEE